MPSPSATAERRGLQPCWPPSWLCREGTRNSTRLSAGPASGVEAPVSVNYPVLPIGTEYPLLVGSQTDEYDMHVVLPVLMKCLIVFVLTCWSCSFALAQCEKPSESPRLPVRIGEQYGYIDRTGHVGIKPQFTSVRKFTEGRAFVWIGHREYAYIDEAGNIVAKTGDFASDENADFHEGLAPSCVDRMCGYIDRTGKEVIPRQFKDDSFPSAPVHCFSEGLAAIRVNDKWGYIDKSGKMIVRPQFETAEAYHEGLAAVELDGKYGFIEKNGKFVINPQFDFATRFSEGLARVNVGWKKQAMNEHDPGWNKGKWGFINRKGKFAVPPIFAFVDDLHCGIAIANTTDKKLAMIDRSGKFVVEPSDKPVGYFSDGLRPIKAEDGKYGYISTDGKFAIQPQYTLAEEFSGGLARVMVGHVEGYIDTTGRYIWKFPSAQFVPEEGHAKVRVSSVGSVELRFEVTNFWENDAVLPNCGNDDYHVELCSEFTAMERLTAAGWSPVKQRPSCCGGIGYPIGEYYKRVTIKPGSHVYAMFRFSPGSLLIEKDKPLRLRVFVYDAKDMVIPTPLTQHKSQAIVSDPFDLPKPPEW